MEALCVAEAVFTIGRAPEDLVKEKSDSRFSSEPCREPRRDLGDSGDLALPLPAQLGNQVEPPLRRSAPESRCLSSTRDRCDPAFSATVRAITSSRPDIKEGPPCCQIVELRKTFILCTKLEDHRQYRRPPLMMNEGIGLRTQSRRH